MNLVMWIKAYWPILAGIGTSLAIGAQLAFQLGGVESEFHHTARAAQAQAAELEETDQQLAAKIKRHERRPAHEQTAIRLERIETTQQVMVGEVKRIHTRLDSIADDIRIATRRARHVHP